MAVKTIKLNVVNNVVIKDNDRNTNFSPAALQELSGTQKLIIRFQDIPNEAKYKILNYANLYVYAQATKNTSGSARYELDLSRRYASPNDVTWSNWDGLFKDGQSVRIPDKNTTASEWLAFTLERIDYTKDTLDKCFGITGAYDSIYGIRSYVYTGNSSYKPYIEIEYEDTLVPATVTAQNFTSGFYNRFNASSPKWTFKQTDTSLYPLTVASETFYWRESGSSTWNSIEGSGGQCYVPANTFPAGDVEWYATVTDNLGRVWSSPTYTISTADTAAVVTPQSPKDGFANEREPITFTWTYSSKYNKQSKADLYWGVTGGEWQFLGTAEGNVRSFTAPAGFFEGQQVVHWCIQGYNADGVAGQFSEPASFTTADSAAVGTPLSPSNTVEDGNNPITFTWQHANNTGTEQSAADLEWSSDGATWNALTTIEGSEKSFTAPGDTFPAGTIYWRVRTYNSDGVAGAWSAALTFISVAAPAAPTVKADGKPFSAITWQASGQQAYSVKIDGVEYGPYFGAGKSFKLKEKLADGAHSASVKIQGNFGLWSQEGTTDFQIGNIPGAAIKLKVIFDHAPRLNWSTEGTYSAFQIYRNGKLVGKTTGTSFVDNLAIGNCSYQLVGIMADGNYTESNIVKGAVCLPCTMICELERREWQKLELSAKSYPERNFSESQNHSNRHFCGAALPVLELSQHRNKSGSYEAAFKCRKDAEAFEKLMGKVVCIKSKPDDMIIGGLLDWQKLQGEFYAAYSFTVSAIYWEDYRDETDS